MKIAVFIVALLAASVACQAQNTVEVCMTDLQNDVQFVQGLVDSVKSKNVLDIVMKVTMAQPLVQKTVADCKAIKKTDIIGFAYSKLNAAQKDCLASIMGTVFAANTIKQSVDQKNYLQVIQDLANLTTQVQDTKQKCNGHFGLKFEGKP